MIIYKWKNNTKKKKKNTSWNLISLILYKFIPSVSYEWANILLNIYNYMQFSIYKNNKPHKQLILNTKTNTADFTVLLTHWQNFF